MFGDDVLKLRSYLEISHPMENGIIQNWDDMELLWHHTFEDCLGVKPDEHKILLTEPPLNPKKNRERMLEIMFEKFGFQGAYVGVQAVLTLYAQGTALLVIDVIVDIFRTAKWCCGGFRRWGYSHCARV